jgi:hypothetical protein
MGNTPSYSETCQRLIDLIDDDMTKTEILDIIGRPYFTRKFGDNKDSLELHLDLFKLSFPLTKSEIMIQLLAGATGEEIDETSEETNDEIAEEINEETNGGTVDESKNKKVKEVKKGDLRFNQLGINTYDLCLSCYEGGLGGLTEGLKSVMEKTINCQNKEEIGCIECDGCGERLMDVEIDENQEKTVKVEEHWTTWNYFEFPEYDTWNPNE